MYNSVRQHKGIIAGGFLLILVIAGMFMFAYFKKNELKEATPSVPRVQEPVTSPYDSISRIDAKHFFSNGVHTIVGEILMPTQCDLLNWNSRVAESFPEQVTVHFTVVNNDDSCAQVVTPQRFKESFTASVGASINATFQGRSIELNLIPADPSETPEDFELFIKG